MEAAGPVKGFAVALTLGIIASLFSALIVTRNGFAWATDRFGVKQITMMHFFENPNFDFMGKARACIAGSLVIIGLSIAVFAVRGEKNFGIDFRGGDLTVLSSRQKLDTWRGAHGPDAHPPAGGHHPGRGKPRQALADDPQPRRHGHGDPDSASSVAFPVRAWRLGSMKRWARWWASSWR